VESGPDRPAPGAGSASKRGLVAIAGAGFAGLSLACMLLRAGQLVVVLERRPRIPTGGAAVAIQPNGLTVLERLGLLERALASGSRIDRMLMHDRRGRLAAEVNLGELEHPHPFLLIVARSELLRVLADEVARLGGEVLLGAEVVGLVRRGDTVQGVRYERDGERVELRARFVAGADGVRSVVARELGIARRAWGSQQRYVVGIGARPTLLKDGSALVHHGTGYSDGVMPLGKGAYFYDSVTSENRAAVDARDLEGWRAVYAKRVPCAAELTAPIQSWNQLSVLEARPSRAARRTRDGAGLLGDAAACVHPHSAQGANLALEDGAALGELLAGLDPGREVRRSDLAPYERERGRKAARYVAWSRLIGWSLDGPTALARANRWSSWQWLRLRPARRAVLRWTAGLS
jgi:2-polyprenyl-6-methoxyphenol hydroxylase-like FAD-dependent oxidoreductase